MVMNGFSASNARVCSNAWEVSTHTSRVFTQTVNQKALTWVTMILSISLGLIRESITMLVVVVLRQEEGRRTTIFSPAQSKLQLQAPQLLLDKANPSTSSMVRWCWLIVWRMGR